MVSRRNLTKYVFPNREKAAAKQRRTWRRLLSMGKRNLGLPAIRRVRA